MLAKNGILVVGVTNIGMGVADEINRLNFGHGESVSALRKYLMSTALGSLPK